jgi:alpha-L-fucosidase
MKKIFFALSVFILHSCTSNAQEKFGPTPTKEQLAWHDKEYYFFMHFLN